MKRIRISLVVVALVLTTGLSLMTSAKQPATTYCSPLPNGQGGVAQPASYGCYTPGSVVCCYRIPDNAVITKNWQ